MLNYQRVYFIFSYFLSKFPGQAAPSPAPCPGPAPGFVHRNALELVVLTRQAWAQGRMSEYVGILKDVTVDKHVFRQGKTCLFCF